MYKMYLWWLHFSLNKASAELWDMQALCNMGRLLQLGLAFFLLVTATRGTVAYGDVPGRTTSTPQLFVVLRLRD